MLRRHSLPSLAGALLAFAAAVSSVSTLARAEVSEVRFARNLGLGYLPLYVMQSRKLVEKHAAAAGLGEVKASYIPVNSPGAVNDTLLSGNADYGIAGIHGMIIAWDKTKGSVGIRGLAALSSTTLQLNTNKPGITRLEDFTEADRIALPTVGVSSQAYVLQRAAEKIYGPGQHKHFDTITVSLSHPNGLAALLAGKTEITGHFTTPPFAALELNDPKVHKVTTEAELLGYRSTTMGIWTTKAFYEANPKVNRAVLAAIEEAVGFIRANPKEAAAAFVAIEGASATLTQELVEKIIASDDVDYHIVPKGVAEWAQFMQRTGAIKNRPASWTELYFDAIHDRPGS
jgi:NitT/TauT family transport system substrate-binding protein